MRVPCVLIVEDDLLTQKLFVHVLRPRYRVLCTRQSREALELAREEQPDVILCDLMLPGRNGFALFQALQEEERTRRIPFVLMTAATRRHYEKQGRTLGISEYLVKPFTMDELLHRIAALAA